MKDNPVPRLFLACLLALLPAAGRSQAVLQGEPLKEMAYDDLVADRLKDFFSRQDRETFPFAATADESRWVPVDIKPACNMNLYAGDGPVCPVQLPFMALGRRTFYGVPCELIDPARNDGKSAVALASERLQPKLLPDSVTLPVGRRLTMLYVLLASYYTSAAGEQFIRLDYADGTSHAFPITGTIDTGDWYHPHTRVYSDTTRCVLAPAAKDTRTHFRNLHLIERENPHPAREIKSVTIKTDRNAEMAFLIAAVTGYAAE